MDVKLISDSSEENILKVSHNRVVRTRSGTNSEQGERN
jgi:hypothetical protein